MTHGSLFSGIGGFDLAAEWMGWTNLFHCEWEDFPRKVLHHYWPDAVSFKDIKNADFTPFRGRIDIITGGFPCQPYSQAGKRLGKADERHLWPEMLRCVREVQPRWVVAENVLGIINWNGGLVFEEVCADLENEGYAVQPFVLPAAGVDAPHQRYRTWFVAYRDGIVWGERGKIESAKQSRHGEIMEKGIRQRTPADTDSSATGQSETGRDHGEGIAVDDKTIGRWDKAVFDSRLYEVSWAPADTEEDGGGRIIRNVEKTDDEFTESKEQHKDKTSTGDFSSKRYAADTSNKGLEREPNERKFGTQRKKLHEQSAGCIRPDWQDFPTQPPVRGRDDGVPDRLDTSAISYPKWRNESIKAYGNAIVPQVALQIFKAIHQYEIQKADTPQTGILGEEELPL